MKRFSCIIAAAILLLTLTSCFSNEKEIVSSDDNSFDGVVLPYLTGDETADCIKINSSDKAFVFQGNVISSDDGIDFEKAANYYNEQKEKDNLISGYFSGLELQFSESIPKSVMWYDIFRKDGDIIADYAYVASNSLSTVDKTATLKFGTNPAFYPFSSKAEDAFPTIVRIVCEYDDQLVEYYVCFVSGGFYNNPALS
jgi:hypothetical protein